MLFPAQVTDVIEQKLEVVQGKYFFHEAGLCKICRPSLDCEYARSMERKFDSELPLEAGQIEDLKLLEGLSRNVGCNLQKPRQTRVSLRCLRLIKGIDSIPKMNAVRCPGAEALNGI